METFSRRELIQFANYLLVKYGIVDKNGDAYTATSKDIDDWANAKYNKTKTDNKEVDETLMDIIKRIGR